MKFKRGYKYQLAESEVFQTRMRPEQDIRTAFLRLKTSREMKVFASYAWDGASGPAWDSQSNYRGSLGHDCEAQIIRMGLLPQSARIASNKDLYDWCVEDGMWRIRAKAWKIALDKFGAPSTNPKNQRKVYEAP